MERYKCIIAYDGTHYAGYQIQPNKRTVQSELEAALAKLHKGTEVKVFASGRTDAKVHAKGQVIHFDSPLGIPLDKWTTALNSKLPVDLSVLQVEKTAASFHARFDAIGKEYRYFIHLSPIRDPFQRNFAYRFSFPLNFSAMHQACQFLEGTHDFTSFCSAKTEVVDRVRTIHKIEFSESNGVLEFRFVGTGFLYNMVRILMGTLLEVGMGERAATSMLEILAKKDRTFAGKTAPGHGLFLWEVFYENDKRI
jgi:tRNA pseudouridine38-40 synthase